MAGQSSDSIVGAVAVPKRSPAPSPRRPAPSPRNNPAQSPRAIPTSAGAIAPVPPRQRRVTCTIEAPDGSEETRLLSGHLADASLEEVRRAAKAKFSRRASSELFVKADAGDGTEVTLVDDDDWRLAREQLAALEHLKLRLSPDRRLRPGRRASVADRAAKTAWTEANGAGPSSSGGGAGPSAAGGAAGGAGSGGGTGRCSMSGEEMRRMLQQLVETTRAAAAAAPPPMAMGAMAPPSAP